MPTNWFFFSSLTLSITTLFLAIVLFKYGKDKIHRMWMWFNLSVFIWGLGALLISKTVNQSLSNIFWRFAGTGVSLTSVCVLHMVYLIEGQSIHSLKKKLILPYSLAIFYDILMTTTNLVIKTPENRYCDFFYFVSPSHLYLSWFLFWILTISYAHFRLISFYKNQQTKKRKELKYLALLIVTAFAFGSLNFLNVFKLPIFQIGNFGVTVYCLFATYAIFKHQLLGIEVIFKKGLLYSILIAILTAIYLLVVMTTERLFRGLLGYRSLLISLISAFTIALLFNPLRSRLQALLDRFFLGKSPQEIARENELLRQEVERSERLKTAATLSLGLAHEIKNPLTTIKTFAEYLPEKYQDEDFVKKFSRLIPQEVERINHIIRDLLTFSKPTPPAFKEISIHELLKNILSYLSSDFLKKKIVVAEHYADAQIPIKADPEQLKQVFLNLILNAVDAMPGGGTLTITTAVAEEKNEMTISVSDTGCGIIHENLGKIFDPFFTTKETGTGLGLSIAHQIIKITGES